MVHCISSVSVYVIGCRWKAVNGVYRLFLSKRAQAFVDEATFAEPGPTI